MHELSYIIISRGWYTGQKHAPSRLSFLQQLHRLFLLLCVSAKTIQAWLSLSNMYKNVGFKEVSYNYMRPPATVSASSILMDYVATMLSYRFWQGSIVLHILCVDYQSAFFTLDLWCTKLGYSWATHSQCCFVNTTYVAMLCQCITFIIFLRKIKRLFIAVEPDELT